MCECYKIGGRFIAEDPECPVHGYAAVQEQEEREREERARDDEIEMLKSELASLRGEVQRLNSLLQNKVS